MSSRVMKPAEESGRLLKQMVRSAARQPAIVACLSFYWFWQLAFLQSPASLPFEAVPTTLLSPQLAILVASAVAYLVAWRQHGRIAALAGHLAYRIGIVAAMAAGTLALLSTGLSPVPTELARGIGLLAAIPMGAGAALFVVELGRIFAQLGSLYALLAGVIGIFGGALLYAIVVSLPYPVAVVALSAAPCAAAVALEASSRQFPKSRLYSHGLDKQLHFPGKFAVTGFVQGIGLGCMTALFAIAPSNAESLLHVTAFVFGGILLLVTAITLKMDFNHLVYQVGFPLTALGFLIMTCAPALGGASGFLLTIGYCYIYVMATCICTYFSNCLKCSPGWIVSLATFFLVVGQAIGFVACGVVPEIVGKPLGDLTGTISAVLAFVLPTSALLLLSNENPISAWGAIKPGERLVTTDEALFAKISSDFRLSSRETEVTALLAKGRNKRYISQELNLAEETVKTHIGNIYRKMLVHSQQELIDLVENERAARDR